MEAVVEFLRQFGAWGLFVHAMIDAIIFPIPAFFLQVSLSLFNPQSALVLATVGFIGCLIGTPVGYGIGKLSGKVLLNRVLKREWVDKATALFEKNGSAAILIGAFTPIPFKVFTILSGGLNFPLWKLMIFAAIGRAAKFYIVGAMFYMYGRAAEGMVKDVSLYLFLIAVPLIAGGLLVKRKLKNRAAKSAVKEKAPEPGEVPEMGAAAETNKAPGQGAAAETSSFEAQKLGDGATASQIDTQSLQPGEAEAAAAGIEASELDSAAADRPFEAAAGAEPDETAQEVESAQEAESAQGAESAQDAETMPDAQPIKKRVARSAEH